MFPPATTPRSDLLPPPPTAQGLSSCQCQNIKFHFQAALPWLRWHQWGLLQKEEGDVVGHDGQHVDDVHPVDEEVDLVGAAGEPQEVLKGEPGDANRLNQGELWIVKRLS